MQAQIKIVGVSDVESPIRVLNYVGPEHENGEMAPEVGFEPTTNRLTADRSTTELLRNFIFIHFRPFC